MKFSYSFHSSLNLHLFFLICFILQLNFKIECLDDGYLKISNVILIIWADQLLHGWLEFVKLNDWSCCQLAGVGDVVEKCDWHGKWWGRKFWTNFWNVKSLRSQFTGNLTLQNLENFLKKIFFPVFWPFTVIFIWKRWLFEEKNYVKPFSSITCIGEDQRSLAPEIFNR